MDHLHYSLKRIGEVASLGVVQKNNNTIMSKTHRSTKLCRIKVVDVEQIGPPIFVTSFI